MSDDLPFELPSITDKEIRWASHLLGLPDDAFHGETGDDPRQDVLKSMERIDVAACPGSGKTTLLVAKLAILAEKWQHRTRGICVLSHTNAARHEIESRLGNTTAGQRLLTYPHFIGTIHAFVGAFLAIPWLRSRGYRVMMIDTAISLERRWHMLPHACRSGLERNRHSRSILSIQTPDFHVGQLRWGRGVLGADTTTYLAIREACERSISAGFHCYDEMFVWAGELMDKVPSVVQVIRSRFPLLLIDEAQDNREGQSAILDRIFMAGDHPVIRQRFGDPNQAIFISENDKGATTDLFPHDGAKKNLPNSHRFGENIAQLAGPLGVTQYDGGLMGQGPSTHSISRLREGRHTIFLFSDDGTGKALEAYSNLLLETFSKQELHDGTFTAVGHRHTPLDKEESHKFPFHVGHYWPNYDPELTKIDPQPQRFVQYVFAGQAKAATAGETHPAVEKIAAGILRLAAMAGGGEAFPRRRHNHRQVMGLLEDLADARKHYLDFVANFAAGRNAISEELWEEDWRQVVHGIGEAVANAKLSGTGVDNFLAWKENVGSPASSSSSPRGNDNIYRYTKDGLKVEIRVGSIHSVKGETHTATLVLETFWYGHNLKELLPWLNGSKSGRQSASERQTTRLKLHYVAMTRPTHLLCLAMKNSNPKNEKEGLDQSQVGELEDHGWRVEVI